MCLCLTTLMCIKPDINAMMLCASLGRLVSGQPPIELFSEQQEKERPHKRLPDTACLTISHILFSHDSLSAVSIRIITAVIAALWLPTSPSAPSTA